MDRREFVKGCVLVGVGAAVGGTGVLLGKQVLERPADVKPSPIRWPDGEPATVADLDAATDRFLSLTWGDYPASVVKVPVAALRAASLLRGVNTGQYALQHPTDRDNAIVVYEGRCTHLGCTVGWNPSLGGSKDEADYDGDGVNDGRMMCPCHQSQFDVHDLGTNVPGRPAQRPLPVIRFRLEDGVLVGVERIAQTGQHRADRDGAGAPFVLGTQV